MEPGTLFVAATPIGNLGDVTQRLRDILGRCEMVLSEDTRRTRQLCAALAVSPRLVRCDEHEEERRIPEVLDALRAGRDVALVTDAGTPAISDPGHRIVRAAHGAGLPCRAVPGPSALVAALSVSGLPASSFAFEGFLPRKRGARRRLLAALADEPRTLVFFESPWRVVESLADMCESFGPEREAFLGRELTKLHEEAMLSTLGGLRERVGGAVKGEVVLVVAGASATGAVEDAGAESASREELIAEVDDLVEAGASEKDALRAVGRAHRLSRRDVYRLVKIAAAQEDADGVDDPEPPGDE